jgi:pimeloyl-ACP methyl ester carboxylesterase
VIFAFSCSYLPTDEDLADTIDYIETPDHLYLSSGNVQDSVGFMFLPGGLVDPHAYLTLMQKVAGDSIPVVIPKFSANLGILELSKYRSLMNQYPDIGTWYIGGHSLGGIVALSAVSSDPDRFKGLILLGVYPSESFAIPDWDEHVLSIYAENDQLSTVEEIENGVSLLPPANFITDVETFDTLDSATPNTVYYFIQGGNHSQFGDYGPQEGDGIALITREEQHQQVHEAIIAFIRWSDDE